MNAVLQTIARRRSVRRFKEEQIRDDELRAVLEAGTQAPSGHNDQSWYFIAVRNKALIREISEGSKAEMRKSSVEWIAGAGRNEAFHIFYDAPTVILVAARKDAVSPFADACAAVQNMLLAAESLGLGACWIGFAKFYFKNPEAYRKLGFPDGYEFYNAVALGYKADGPAPNPPVRKSESYYRIIP